MEAIAETGRTDEGDLAHAHGALRGDAARRAAWCARARRALASDVEGSRAFAGAFRDPDKANAEAVLAFLLEGASTTTSFAPDAVASVRWVPVRGTDAALGALHASNLLRRDWRRRGPGWDAAHRALGYDVDPDELLWAVATAPASFVATCRQLMRAAVTAERAGSGDVAPVHGLRRMRRGDGDGAMLDGTIASLVPVVRLSIGPEPAGSAMACDWPGPEAVRVAAGLGVEVGTTRFLAAATRWRFEGATRGAPRGHPEPFAGAIGTVGLRVRGGGCDVEVDGIPVTSVNAHVMDVVGPGGLAALRRGLEASGGRLVVDDPRERYEGYGTPVEGRASSKGWN